MDLNKTKLKKNTVRHIQYKDFACELASYIAIVTFDKTVNTY